MTIGQVLARLRDDFPDLSISKIRFLEAEGLVLPERTPSGYRKFADDDVDRLRYVLSAQRDHYLPLKIIREHLDALDRGLEPPRMPGDSPTAPESQVQPEGEGSPEPARRAEVRLSRAELMANAGLDESTFRQLEEFAMIGPAPGSEYYGLDDLEVARAVASFARFGLEVRHLRHFKTAADRQVGLVEQVVAPRRGKTSAQGARLAEGMIDQAQSLHGALVRTAVRRAGLTEADDPR